MWRFEALFKGVSSTLFGPRTIEQSNEIRLLFRLRLGWGSMKRPFQTKSREVRTNMSEGAFEAETTVGRLLLS